MVKAAAVLAGFSRRQGMEWRQQQIQFKEGQSQMGE